MSDRFRTSVLFSVLALVAACGGGSAPSATKCPEGMSGPQACMGKTDPACPGAPLVALCMNGQWGQCACSGAGTMTGAQTMTGAPQQAVAVCGNGKAEGDEQCDGEDFKGMTCATLGMGNASAKLMCKPDRCVIDTIMCFSAGPMSGGAGTGSGGTGATASGAAGAGGSGR
jgi:hypothetical protein